MGISLRFWPRKWLFVLFLGSTCSLFITEFLVLSLPDSPDCNKPVSGTFYFGQFFDEIRGCLRFWPRKRPFGADFGVLVLVIFRRDAGIVTTRLADSNEPVSGTFYSGQFFDEIRGY